MFVLHVSLFPIAFLFHTRKSLQRDLFAADGAPHFKALKLLFLLQARGLGSPVL